VLLGGFPEGVGVEAEVGVVALASADLVQILVRSGGEETICGTVLPL
jgi:hypothetical protein